jgi:hypothetical protein
MVKEHIGILVGIVKLNLHVGFILLAGKYFSERKMEGRADEQTDE